MSNKMASLDMLERKIDKHAKETSVQIDYFKSELQCLKTFPKPRVPRPSSVLIKAKEIPKNQRLEEITKAPTKSLKQKEKGADDTKMSKKTVKLLLRQFHVKDV